MKPVPQVLFVLPMQLLSVTGRYWRTAGIQRRVFK